MISSRVNSGTTRWSSTRGNAPRPGRCRGTPGGAKALRLTPERFSSIGNIIADSPARQGAALRLAAHPFSGRAQGPQHCGEESVALSGLGIVLGPGPGISSQALFFRRFAAVEGAIV